MCGCVGEGERGRGCKWSKLCGVSCSVKTIVVQSGLLRWANMVAARGGEKMVGPSGREGQKRSTSLMEAQVAPLGLQVFPQQTPTVEQVFWRMNNVMAHCQGRGGKVYRTIGSCTPR